MTPVLPRHFDNVFRGHVVALWLFVLILVVKTGIALATVFNGREAAQSADGIPLTAFGPGGADTVVALFAIWGVTYLAVSAFGILAVARYRAMIPLMYVVLLLEHLARRAVLFAKPIARADGAPGGYINMVLLALMAVGLALSLWDQDRAQPKHSVD